MRKSKKTDWPPANSSLMVDKRKKGRSKQIVVKLVVEVMASSRRRCFRGESWDSSCLKGRPGRIERNARNDRINTGSMRQGMHGSWQSGSDRVVKSSQAWADKNESRTSLRRTHMSLVVGGAVVRSNKGDEMLERTGHQRSKDRWGQGVVSSLG